MDISELDEHMKSISKFCGVCLSLEEVIKLQTVLDKLKSEINSEQILFWGKINGIEKDYYIAESLQYKNNPSFPKKKFYFASSANFIFSQLPEISLHHLKDFKKHNTYFIGNPDIILEKYESSSVDSAIEEEEEIDKGNFHPKLKAKNLTEADKLSYTVRLIDNDTSVVPEGAYKMLPIGEMRLNDLFEGLSRDDLGNLEKYFHFRPVQSEEKKELIAMGAAVFDFAFLDSIENDTIKGSWSIQVDGAKSISHLRNLIWPGYFAYHKANTEMFGGVYIGFGIKNKDISFMQQ